VASSSEVLEASTLESFSIRVDNVVEKDTEETRRGSVEDSSTTMVAPANPFLFGCAIMSAVTGQSDEWGFGISFEGHSINAQAARVSHKHEHCFK